MKCSSQGALGGNHNTRQYMKTIIFLIGAVILLTTAGCIVVPEHRHGWHHHEYREYHSYPEPGVDLHIHTEG